MIAIIGAMDEEVAMLKEKMTEVQVESRACMEFYKGKLEGKDTVVVRSGIGKVNGCFLNKTSHIMVFMHKNKRFMHKCIHMHKKKTRELYCIISDVTRREREQKTPD